MRWRRFVSFVSANAKFAIYSQGGRGSIYRTVESRLQDLVSVKDFGALGRGHEDDDDFRAIQDAIDYLGNYGGGILHFPPRRT